MIQQFFTVNNIEQFIETEEGQAVRCESEPFLNAVDLRQDLWKSGFINYGSSFAACANDGGEEALAPLKEPFTEKKIKITPGRHDWGLTALKAATKQWFGRA